MFCFSCYPLVEEGFSLFYLFKFRARMWAWDRYGPQLKNLVPDVSFVSTCWILGFVFAIGSAPCHFLYHNNQYMIYKKKEKRKKEKKKPPISFPV